MKTFTFMASLITAVPMFGQLWITNYDGPANADDKAFAIVVDDSGNSYVTGQSWGNDNSYDFATSKYDPSGNPLWLDRFNGSGHDDVVKALTIDKNYIYITGCSMDSNYYTDCITIKYDFSGTPLWTKKYCCPDSINDNDEVNAIAVDNKGNCYIAGHSTSTGNWWDCLTVKYNPSGDTEWVRIYATADYDYLSAVTVDTFGNVYVTGATGSIYTNSWDYITIKYDSSGDSMWTRRYNGTADDGDEAKGIVTDNKGNIYVTGVSIGLGTDYDFVTLKYDSSGTESWVKRYNSPENNYDWANVIAIDKTDNIYIAGGSTGTGSDWDYFIIKYNSAGDSVWAQRYNGAGNGQDEIKAIAIDENNNVYVTGSTYDSTNGTDYLTIKYDSSGNLQWAEIYDGQGHSNDYAYAIAVDNMYAYVTGETNISGGNFDYTTLKYACVGIEENNSTGINSVKLLKNYPNPFVKSTIIDYQLPVNAKVSLKVYNITGKMVKTLLNREMTAGTHNVKLNAENLSSGVYFVRLSAGNHTDTKRIVLLK